MMAFPFIYTKHSPIKLHTISNESMTELLESLLLLPYFFNIMNLPVAAKLIIFKKYFYVS